MTILYLPGGHERTTEHSGDQANGPSQSADALASQANEPSDESALVVNELWIRSQLNNRGEEDAWFSIVVTRDKKTEFVKLQQFDAQAFGAEAWNHAQIAGSDIALRLKIPLKVRRDRSAID